jgi:membrane-associated protease RseP (regulator of RpoE activity)
MHRDESGLNRSSADLSPASSDDSDEDERVDEERPLFSTVILPGLLFLLTVCTVLWAGAYQTNTNPLVGPWNFLVDDPRAIWRGIPFAATLLGILVTHELGHYILSRVHGVPTSLPLFVPGMPHFVGTFGAIIRMRAPMTDRRALFDIGVAGPIAGFVVAVVALVIGLRLSTVVPTQTSYGLHLGEPLLLQFVSWLVLGPLSPTADVVLHPIGFAAWFGLFITSLNLLPIGQLDGGHVAYAMWGPRQRSVAVALVPILMLFGELGGARLMVGWMALAIFAITFSWEPFVLR